MEKLIQKNGVWYCSKCKMRQFTPSPMCTFCFSLFENYEEIINGNYSKHD